MDAILFPSVIGLLAVFFQVLMVSGINTDAISVMGRLIKGQIRRCSGPDHYVCSSGECLMKRQLCDGLIDCKDKSDETAAICQSVYTTKCGEDWWQCSYGACIAKAQRCDTREDCWDGSDEAGCPQMPPSRKPQESRPTTVLEVLQSNYSVKPCELPEAASNRQFYTWSGELTQMLPGAFVSSNNLLIVSCDSGYEFGPEVGRQFVTNCTNGKWFYNIPSCYKLCPRITTSEAIMKCHPRDCESPMTADTVIEFGCEVFKEFRVKQSHRITCNKEGQWSGPVPHCEPVCGKSTMNYHILLNKTGERKSEVGYFPWHSGLYHMKENKWELACGGTLISPRIVLTAANCVTNASRVDVPPLPREYMLVALGKKYNDMNVTEITEQLFEINKVVVHPDYRGALKMFANDVALLLLDHAVEASTYVMPACINYTNLYSMDVEVDQSIEGYIAWWGYKEDCSLLGDRCGSQRDTLVYYQLPIIPGRECYRLTHTTSPSPESLLAEDKYCTGNGTDTMHQGDTGAGQTIIHNGRHYVIGIYSLRIMFPDYEYAALTNVSYHKKWILQEVQRLSESSS